MDSVLGIFFFLIAYGGGGGQIYQLTAYSLQIFQLTNLNIFLSRYFIVRDVSGSFKGEKDWTLKLPIFD